MHEGAGTSVRLVRSSHELRIYETAPAAKARNIARTGNGITFTHETFYLSAVGQRDCADCKGRRNICQESAEHSGGHAPKLDFNRRTGPIQGAGKAGLGRVCIW